SGPGQGRAQRREHGRPRQSRLRRSAGPHPRHALRRARRGRGGREGECRMTSQIGAVRPPLRPEFVRETLDASNIGEIVRPLSAWERISNVTLVRRVFILVVLAAAWQAYGTWLENDLIFPTFGTVFAALWKVTISGELPARVLASIKVLL